VETIIHIKNLCFFNICVKKKSKMGKRAIKKAINSDKNKFPEGLLNTNGYYPIDCVLNEDDPDYFNWLTTQM
jgi:hypothetical protein